jgi:cytoskeletal protein RodZ
MSKVDKTSSKKKKEETPGEVVSTGVMLQRLREEKGMGIQQISNEIYVSVSNLLAIENEDFSRLPADTFIRGQIVLYGNYLGVDGIEAARSFFQERDQKVKGKKKGRGKQAASLSAKKLAEPAQVSSATFAGILLLLIIVSGTSFCLYTSWNPFAYFMKDQEPSQVAPYGEQLTTEPESTETGSSVTPEKAAPAPTDTTEQKKAAGTVIVPPFALNAVFTRDSAVEVVVDDQEPLHLQVKKDEQQQWQAEKEMQISFEYPDSAVITVNGTTVSFPEHEQDGKPTLRLPEDLPAD